MIDEVAQGIVQIIFEFLIFAPYEWFTQKVAKMPRRSDRKVPPPQKHA